jgi:hypothetical protein
MKWENILKGPVMSTIGTVAMAGSIYAMITGTLPAQWEGAVVFGLGFSCLFMKDQIPGWIKRIVNKNINGTNP